MLMLKSFLVRNKQLQLKKIRKEFAKFTKFRQWQNIKIHIKKIVPMSSHCKREKNCLALYFLGAKNS